MNLLQLLARVAFLNLSVVEIFDLNEASVYITLGTETRLAYHDVALGLHSISNSFLIRPEVSSKIEKIYLLWCRPIARHLGLCARFVKSRPSCAL